MSTRRIRQRIRSVKNTRKITKAMELVAASKMRRATAHVVGSRPFSSLAWSTVVAVSRHVEGALHPLLVSPKKAERSLLVLFTSDRGLCGGFNVRVLKEMLLWAQMRSGNVDIIAVGRRGEQTAHRAHLPVLASFTGLSNHPVFTDTRPIAKLVQDEFLRGTYKDVSIAYTDFVSALSQKPTLFRLLPLSQEDIEGLGSVGEMSGSAPAPAIFKDTSIRFEPSPRSVLDKLLPRVVEIRMWQALLESSASEHSSRMMAMRSATDAASEMIDDLTLTFNQARQANITKEIAEISAGKAAIE